MAAHTPGPWATYCCNPGQRNGVIYSESLPESSASICDLVADTCIKDNDRRRGDKWVFSDRRAADARLIAAAPEMYEMLQRVRAAIGRQDGFSSLNGFEDLIDRVIEKIKG